MTSSHSVTMRIALRRPIDVTDLVFRILPSRPMWHYCDRLLAHEYHCLMGIAARKSAEDVVEVSIIAWVNWPGQGDASPFIAESYHG